MACVVQSSVVEEEIRKVRVVSNPSSRANSLTLDLDKYETSSSDCSGPISPGAQPDER